MNANARSKSSTILWPVTIPALVLMLLLIGGTISNPTLANDIFTNVLAYLTRTFGWFYMLSVSIFLVFVVGIAMSGWGNIKLGPDHAEPEYSFVSWFSMLFSAGYGVALLFFGVAEPVLHYSTPPVGTALTVDAARQAMQIAFFHWGFHIWSIYALVGLVLAYFAFRHGLPLSMRSTLYPLIGERIYGPLGHFVDIVAILGTMFGIATTLGLSVTQINAGIHYLWPTVPIGIEVQVTCIIVITGLATLSVVAGMDKGVKRLSLLNMVLAVALMTFVFVTGPTIFILEAFLQNTGSYLNNIVERTFNLQAYKKSDWIGNWTLFIFGWTIAWAPFVGLFIAKISRGRTIRQFVFGVMLVPTTFTFLWFSIFGDTALHLIMVDGYTSLIADVQADHAIALFKLFELLPFTQIVSFLTVILIMTFFVTSSDSGSLVIDSLASGGVATPVWQRAFWAILAGILAAALLIAGGLNALQTMTITSALPFAIIMLIAAVGMWRALIIEGHHQSSQQAHMTTSHQGEVPHPGFWKKRLARLVKFPQRKEVEEFISDKVMESMHQVQRELLKHGWPAKVEFDEENCRAHFDIIKPAEMEFIYEIRLRVYAMPTYVFPSIDAESIAVAESTDATDTETEEKYYRAEVFLRRGGQSYDIYGYAKQDIINDILDQFEKYLHFLDVSPGILPWKMADHKDDMLEPDEEDTNT